MRKGERKEGGIGFHVSIIQNSPPPPPPPLSQRTELRIFVFDFEHVRGGNRSACVYIIIRGIGKREMQEMQKKKKKKRIIGLLIGPNICLYSF